LPTGESAYGGGFWWRPTQGVQSLQVTVNFAFSVKGILITGTQIMERNAMFKDMVNRYQHGVRHGDRCPIPTSPRGNTLILCREERILNVID